MQLFYSAHKQGEFLVLEGEEHHHCINVLRHSVGDTLYVTNGQGGKFVTKILNSNKNNCLLSIETAENIEAPLSINLTIAIAPTKNIDRFEWFVEKAVEIGVGRITPILTKRSERKILKSERLQKLALAAMKQSAQFYLPIIDEVQTINEVIDQNRSKSKLIAYCNDSQISHIESTITGGESTIIMIGPEGDFTSEEIARALQNGFIGVSLGENRLRTETAGLVSCFYFNQANTR